MERNVSHTHYLLKYADLTQPEMRVLCVFVGSLNGVMKDEELNLEEIEDSHTLGGSGSV